MRHLSLPAAIAEVFITEQLDLRPASAPDYNREKLAIQDLATLMADHHGDLLPRLVQLAMEMCEADSAGVSVLESQVFRWLGLKGKLSVFEGANTPRNFSPCGICLDYHQPILMERPERVYKWIADANITVPEVLLVPLYVANEDLGTLWVVAKEGHKFDSNHARVLTELASFTGVALRMIQGEEKLKKSLDQQEILAKEMSHRVKNVFAIADGLIRVSARNASTKEELAESLTGRLRALSDAHSLVRRSFSTTGSSEGVPLREIFERVLKPYGNSSSMDGPDIKLGEQATNNIALVFHEFATNAAKHGALRDAGFISVNWHEDDNRIVIDWRESGGPAVSKPSKTGFGSSLVRSTLASLKGEANYDWDEDGLHVTITLPQVIMAAKTD